jgi:hypothetical protein
MLTNSFQSTWDPQRMKPRQKLGGFEDDSKYGGGITEEKSFININKTLNAPYRQNELLLNNNNNNSELPNLKIPQVRFSYYTFSFFNLMYSFLLDDNEPHES